MIFSLSFILSVVRAHTVNLGFHIFCLKKTNCTEGFATAFFILPDLGAESEDTDSEEETDGLRFISGPMVPPQYNSDQGSYTTLPQSQSRLAKLPP